MGGGKQERFKEATWQCPGRRRVLKYTRPGSFKKAFVYGLTGTGVHKLKYFVTIKNMFMVKINNIKYRLFLNWVSRLKNVP